MYRRKKHRGYINSSGESFSDTFFNGITSLAWVMYVRVGKIKLLD
jgi:hypothetical protein